MPWKVPTVSPRVPCAISAVAARAHFAGGLVGEGDGKDRPRRGVLDFEQPADAMSQHARLAGAGAGQHQIVAGWRADRFALRRVQVVEQIGYVHREL